MGQQQNLQRTYSQEINEFAINSMDQDLPQQDRAEDSDNLNTSKVPPFESQYFDSQPKQSQQVLDKFKKKVSFQEEESEHYPSLQIKAEQQQTSYFQNPFESIKQSSEALNNYWSPRFKTTEANSEYYNRSPLEICEEIKQSEKVGVESLIIALKKCKQIEQATEQELQECIHILLDCIDNMSPEDEEDLDCFTQETQLQVLKIIYVILFQVYSQQAQLDEVILDRLNNFNSLRVHSFYEVEFYYFLELIFISWKCIQQWDKEYIDYLASIQLLIFNFYQQHEVGESQIRSLLGQCKIYNDELSQIVFIQSHMVINYLQSSSQVLQIQQLFYQYFQEKEGDFDAEIFRRDKSNEVNLENKINLYAYLDLAEQITYNCQHVEIFQQILLDEKMGILNILNHYFLPGDQDDWVIRLKV